MARSASSAMEAAIEEVIATRDDPGAPSARQIALRHGVTPSAMTRQCKKRGIDLAALRQADIDKRNARIAELVQGGMTLSHACALHGVDSSLASKHNAKGTLLGDVVDAVRNPLKAERERMLDEIERIIGQGVSVSEAARRVGMNIKTAHKWLARRPADLAAA